MTLLTVKELQALTVSDHGKRLPDGEAMFGIAQATRTESSPISVYFEWRYKFNGKTRSVRIGTWPKLSLKNIRVERDKLRSEVNDGVDPIERKAADRLKLEADNREAKDYQLNRLEQLEEKQARITVRECFDLWLKIDLKHRKDMGAEAKRSFEHNVFFFIGNIAVADVKKMHIQKIVDTMMERGVVRMTKSVLSLLRQMFNFAMDRDHIELNPTAAIKKSRIGPDVERDRFLNDSELRVFFEILPLSGLTATTIYALLIQISTLTRIGEVLSARWKNVDFENRSWFLPTTKNGKSHRIFLSDFAVKQLASLKEITGSTDWLFPNRNLNGPLDSKTVTKQVKDRQQKNGPMPGRSKQFDALILTGGEWNTHDLRRTGSSAMADLGIRSEVIQRCTNHTDENIVRRTYQRATFEVQMREAWQIWGNKLFLLQKSSENTLTPLAIE